MKKKIIIFAAIFAFVSAAFGIFAYAGDTPIIPIHTKHFYVASITTQPTCTEEGVKTYKCTGCTKSYTEPIAPLGHVFYCNNSEADEGIELICRYCRSTETFSASELLERWNTDYINETPVRAFDNDSCYIDLDGNRIINAKDYGMLVNLSKDEQAAHEAG